MRRVLALLAAVLAGCAWLPLARAARLVGAAADVGASASGSGRGRGTGSVGGTREKALGSEVGLLERGPRGWRRLPARLGVLGKEHLRRLVLKFLATRFYALVHEGVDFEFPATVWELPVSFVDDVSGGVHMNLSLARPVGDYGLRNLTWGTFVSHDNVFAQLLDTSEIGVWPTSLRRKIALFNTTTRGSGIDVSHDGKSVLMWDQTHTEMWSALGYVRWRYPFGGIRRAVAFSPSDDFVAVVDERFAAVLNASSGREMCRFDMVVPDEDRSRKMAFTGDSLKVCRRSGSRFDHNNRLVSLRVVHHSLGGCVLVPDATDMPCDDVVVHNGKAFALHLAEDTITITATEHVFGGAHSPTFGERVGEYSFSPDGGTLVFKLTSGPIVLWPFARGRRPILLRELSEDEEGDPWLPTFSIDGELVFFEGRWIDVASGLDVDGSLPGVFKVYALSRLGYSKARALR